MERFLKRRNKLCILTVRAFKEEVCSLCLARVFMCLSEARVTGRILKIAVLEKNDIRFIPIFSGLFMRLTISIVFVLLVLFHIGTFVQTMQKDSINDNQIIEAFEEDCVVADAAEPSSDEHWIVYPKLEDGSFSFDDCVKSVGRVVSIDNRFIYTEDRRLNKKETIKLCEIKGVVFFPPVHRNEAERFCKTIQESNNNDDKILLTNDDEFEGTFVRMDKRFVYFDAFDVQLRIPRGRVCAIFRKKERSASSNDL